MVEEREKESEGEEGRKAGRKGGTRDALYLDIFCFLCINTKLKVTN